MINAQGLIGQPAYILDIYTPTDTTAEIFGVLDMCLNPIYIPKKGVFPCRKCVECKIMYSEEWARRVMLEAKKHDKNCFITLTYNDANLPQAGVCKRSAQLFMKRLRKQLGKIKVRYFLCGEYGAEKNRSHFHAIIFGYDFDDKYYFGKDKRGNSIYRSPLLEKVWTFGFSSVGERLDFESAKYCAKYMQADGREFDKLGLNRPFVLMSRRPGLALDVIPDTVYKTGDIYFDGKRFLAPRAFLKQVKKEFPEYYENVIALRKLDKYKKLMKDLSIEDREFEITRFDESVQALADDLFWQCAYNKNSSLERRRKKFKEIFGESLDNRFRVVLSLKRFNNKK